MKDFRSYIPGISDPAEFGVFERSVHKTGNGEYVFTARTGKGDRIVAERSAGFKGEGFTGADGKEYVLSGLSIMDREATIAGDYLGEYRLLTDFRELAVNVNTPGELELARKMC